VPAFEGVEELVSGLRVEATFTVALTLPSETGSAPGLNPLIFKKLFLAQWPSIGTDLALLQLYSLQEYNDIKNLT
jgi:hypothetical protein